MKYATKLSLAVSIVLGIALLTANIIFVHLVFNAEMQKATDSALADHTVVRTQMHNQLNQRIASFTLIDEDTVRHILDSALSNSTKLVHIELIPDTETDLLLADGTGYFTVKEQENYSLITQSKIPWLGGSERFVQTRHDISDVFSNRTKLLFSSTIIGLAIFFITIALTYAIIVKMTRPIKHLSHVSVEVAEGNYSVRSHLNTGDEVGVLSKNFDAMLAKQEETFEVLTSHNIEMRDFVSAFTHEIKTPMTSIIGYSDMLRLEDGSPEFRQEAHQFIYREAKRLERLSFKLLALMHISEEEIELMPFSVRHLTNMAIAGCKSLEQPISFYIIPKNDYLILTDADLFVDLLRNLLINAVAANPVDKIVSIDWEVIGKKLCVAVIDRGCGIPMELISRIQEPFYTVDVSRSKSEERTGIGLALVRRILELHNSMLHFESEVGFGTTVSFTFDLAE